MVVKHGCLTLNLLLLLLIMQRGKEMIFSKMMQLNLNQLTSELRMKKNDVYIELVLDGGIIFDAKDYTDGSPSTSLGNTNWNPILSLKILMIENKLTNL